MRVTTTAVVHPGGVLGRLDCAPPLTLRRVRSDDADVCALCLVGTAAGPLAGDELTLDLDVRDGARADLRATGASIAQGRGGTPSTQRVRVRVGAGAELSADPGPLVICDGSHVDVRLAVDLAADAALVWREVVVLGRSHDTGTGTATVRWDVERAGRPVLRQLIDLADPDLRAWNGHLDGQRVIASALATAPGLEATTTVHGPHAVAQQVDAGTVLVTVLGASAHEVTARLDALLAAQRLPAFGPHLASTAVSMIAAIE